MFLTLSFKFLFCASSVQVLEIRCSKVPVNSAISGQSCTVMIKLGTSAVKWLENSKNKDGIRRGMVLADCKSNPKAAYEFLAEIWLWGQNVEEKNLKPSYQPVINTQTTRQSCKMIVEREKEQEESKNQLVPLTLTKKVSKSIDDKKNKYFEEKKIMDDQSICKNIYKFNKGKKNFGKSFQFKEEQLKSLEEGEKFFTIQEFSKTKEQRCKKKHSNITIYPNKKNVLRLRFMYYPEYILVGQKLLINDTSIKAIGWIREIYY